MSVHHNVKESRWNGPVRDLCDFLRAQDKYHEILQDIDNRVMRSHNLGVDGVDEVMPIVHDAGKALAHMIGASGGAFYLRNGQAHYQISSHFGGTHSCWRETINLDSLQWPEKASQDYLTNDTGKGHAFDLTAPGAPHIELLENNDEDVLLGFIVQETTHHPTQEDLLGCFAFSKPSVPHPEMDAFSPDDITSVSTICMQMSNAVRLLVGETREKITNDILKDVMDADMEPLGGLIAILNHIPKLWPMFDGLHFESPNDIGVQLLVWDPRDNGAEHYFTTNQDSLLTMIAVSSNFPDLIHSGTQVLVEKSISGLLVENPSWTEFFCDPTDPQFSLRYRNYAWPDSDIRHELVLPVEMPTIAFKAPPELRPRAILNFETSEPGAFKAFHIEHMQRLLRPGQFLQRMIETLYILWLRNRQGLEAAYQALREYSRHQITWAEHGLRNTTQDIHQLMGLIQRKGQAGDTPGILKELEELREVLETQNKFVREYGALFINAYTNSPRPLRPLVEEALLLINAERIIDDAWRIKAAKTEVRIIDTSIGDPLELNVSTVLAQHFYNIIQNACQSIIRKRNHGHIEEQGLITISISNRKTDPQNRSNQTCTVAFTDNGEGSSDEILDEISRCMRPVTGRQDGSGYGLFSLCQYVKSLRGRFRFGSTQGENFKVELTFRLIPKFNNLEQEA
ncbi:MAG: hypothetical protein HQL35_02630 [Alphaproteobacteria bacterium]|nr:hypothetical protein [Alphaproteobacteria bacterium]